MNFTNLSASVCVFPLPYGGGFSILAHPVAFSPLWLVFQLENQPKMAGF